MIEYFGVITPACLLQASREMEEIEKRRQSSQNRLCTLTGVTTFAIDFAAVLSTAERRRHQHFANNIRDAIVVSGDLQLGFARMYQQLIEHPQIEFGIFNTRVEAVTWLVESIHAT